MLSNLVKKIVPNFHKSEPQIVYRLEKLSELWLNASCRSEESMDKELLLQVDWRHDECKQFWVDYVVGNYREINSAGLLSTIESILGTLDGSDDFPSVDKDDPETEEKYKCLESVTLRSHSIRVAQKTISLLRTHRADSQYIIPKVIVICLAHDMGVMIKDIPNAAHSVNSAKWCQHKLSGMKNVDGIVDAVRLHHAPPNRMPKDILLQALAKSDAEVRQDELGEWKMNQQAQLVTDDADKIQETSTERENSISTQSVNIEPGANKTINKDNPGNDTGSHVSEEKTPSDEQVSTESDIPFGSSEETPETDTDHSVPEDEISDGVKADTKSMEERKEDPMENVHAAKQAWLTEDELLKRLSQKVSHLNFEAFIFDGKGFFLPKVVRATIEEMAIEADDQNFLAILKQFIEPLISDFGMENSQARLRFSGKIPPQKSFYFIIDAGRLNLPDDYEVLNPRAGQRFLKSIKVLEK